MSGTDLLISSKLPKTGTTIFTVMSALAAKHNAVNLSQGFPDFNPDERVLDTVRFFLGKNTHQYVPMPGLPALRNAIAEKTDRVYGYHPDPDQEVTVAAGATQAIFTAIMALTGRGDEVIVFSPSYDCYAPAIQLAGAEVVYCPLSHDTFLPDFDLLSKLISPRTKMIIVNTPNNPAGSVFDELHWRFLIDLIADKNIFVLSDEVYEHMVFDGLAHKSALLYPELKDKRIVISSFGKTYHTTGWKIGYAIASSAITTEFRKVHQFNVFCVNSFLQHAYAEILSHDDLYTSLPAFYQQKRDFFATLMKDSRWELLPCKGTYFQLMSYRNISDLPDMQAAERLTAVHGVAAIPMSPFYPVASNLKLLRFCFAKGEETLRNAATRLCSIELL